MRFPRLLGELLTTLALVISVASVQLQELKPNNFKESTSKGLWFIEYYSPHCGHCRRFAPTWEKLVEAAETEIPSVHLAQVNCAAYGDLCSANGVRAWPTMYMHENGKQLEEFNGKRELDDLKNFIKQYVKPTKDFFVEVEEEDRPIVNSNGQVLSISDAASFTETVKQGPTFVKFFAPWCGHCKKLAPIWVQLAHHLKNKVTVAEVDCEAHSELCAAYKIQGYPTLIYFTRNLQIEYSGGRKLDQLRTFAEKAAEAGLHPLYTDSELADHVQKHDVVYLFLHSDTKGDIVKAAREASEPLLGSPPVYASASQDLFTRYSVPPSATWALLAFKDHDIGKSAGQLYGSPNTPLSEMSPWFMTHRIPSFLELASDSFQSVMNAPQQPLVLIAAVTGETRGKVEAKLEQLASVWKMRTGGTGERNGRQVIFTWMDNEVWKDWLKNMYGIKHEDDDDLDDVRVVIADHARLVYYEEDVSGHKIKLTKSDTLFATIEKATTGELHYKHSQNRVERLARWLNHKLSGVEVYVTAHPYKSVFFLVGGIVVVFTLLIRWLGSSVPHDRDHYKSSRLD
ncbi:hypothetical protein AGABI1DRAFT_55318 [Agaricus bisporus var. burnettii JB137-S8]|uniref:Thioredoxin domain-containing protein n=1 Tax=Agaricus bisporus var. burnettii (strain JB137-S8 / ATCC MYA-4627 / FGSC 10392) TaxID=597362 RepID=K5XFH1_AGABU|nr:uncharacterized protein AGABI1DRAFT_55318 [Agaricus bisporus var. burnettii JB137-S8]EKM82138.1 hypothetical protein AGABI1DRAFT_55318 [Agaricus bisporus var. burnettii JB137-S8]